MFDMLENISVILAEVISWVTSLFSVITANEFLFVFVLLGVASMLIVMTLKLVRGLRK